MVALPAQALYCFVVFALANTSTSPLPTPRIQAHLFKPKRVACCETEMTEVWPRLLYAFIMRHEHDHPYKCEYCEQRVPNSQAKVTELQRNGAGHWIHNTFSTLCRCSIC
jgi:hypothetical protein